jgi:dTDP-4-amino-4,6-dideoxygalactose transaminase
MVVTNDDQIDEKIRMLLAHGNKDKYFHLLAGRNSRLDEIRGAY